MFLFPSWPLTRPSQVSLAQRLQELGGPVRKESTWRYPHCPARTVVFGSRRSGLTNNRVRCWIITLLQNEERQREKEAKIRAYLRPPLSRPLTRSLCVIFGALHRDIGFRARSLPQELLSSPPPSRFALLHFANTTKSLCPASEVSFASFPYHFTSIANPFERMTPNIT